MQAESPRSSSLGSVATVDYSVCAPLQRPLEPTEDLPELDLGHSDCTASVSSNDSGRNRCSRDCFSILGFLQRRVSGMRERVWSEDLKWSRVWELKEEGNGGKL